MQVTLTKTQSKTHTENLLLRKLDITSSIPGISVSC